MSKAKSDSSDGACQSLTACLPAGAAGAAGAILGF
jgi:hypothetical protein